MAYDYDLVVIGGGAAGLTASGIGANLGARTLLIERARLGGDCTWTGCVPSKTLLKSAKVAQQIRRAARYGLTDQPVVVDFGRVMDHVRSTRVDIYEDADKPERLETMGVEVRQGQARFLDDHTIEVKHEGRADRVSGRYFIIAAGGRPHMPPIDGLQDVAYLTNETLFELEQLPARLAVVGAGPVGTEMAQAFRRLGAEVTVIQQGPRILPRDDEELTARLLDILRAEGVHYLFNTAAVHAAPGAGAEICLTVETAGRRRTLQADALLLAAGRQPNLDGLGLQAAGVAYTERGITVDDRCRTNRRHIFAAGDITGRYQFTHMSEHMAKVAATNALTRFPLKIDVRHVPWATYTDPELAHLGATPETLDAAGTRYTVYRFPYRKIDRAVTDGEAEGLIKVYAKKRNGRIFGASILGAGAGDLICEYAVAMRNGVTLRQISDTIHPYPTLGLGARRAADQWYVRNYSPTFVRLLQKVFGYRGPVLEPDPDRIV